jgi:predicted RNase H-like nuclease (RuvC/YqgF family)
MPGKKPPPKDPQPPPGPGWQVILEEILSQNRATIEAVQSTRDELKRDIAQLGEKTDARFQTLESAVRQNGADIRQNSADIRTLQGDVRTLQGDVRNLAEKVDSLSGLEVRVAALERQRG